MILQRNETAIDAVNGRFFLFSLGGRKEKLGVSSGFFDCVGLVGVSLRGPSGGCVFHSFFGGWGWAGVFWLVWFGSVVAIFLALFYRRMGCFYRRLGCFYRYTVGFFLANVSFFLYLCIIEISNIHPLNYVHYG